MDSINNFLDKIPPIIQAILLLLLAFLVAWIVKVIVVKLLNRAHVDERLGTRGMQGTSSGSTSDFVGKLTFLIVFLLFLPSVLDRLSMGSVSDPIVNMVGSIFDYLPNLIAAGLIFYIGHMLARLIGQLLEAVLQRVNIDRIQTKLGVQVTSQNSLASVIGKVVYGLIMIFVVIAGLQALQIHAISDPAVSMLHSILDFLPLLVMGFVVIGLGIFIGGLVGNLVTRVLDGVGADGWLAKILPSDNAEATKKASSFSLSSTVGVIVQVVIILLFVVEGLEILQLDVLTGIGAAIVAYLPSVLAAAVIMVLAVVVGNWVESLITRRSPENRAYGVAAKISILILAVFMTLTQLQLSQTIVTIAFLALVGSVAVAFAIAFGVGGRGFAANRLSKLEKKLDDPAE